MNVEVIRAAVNVPAEAMDMHTWGKRRDICRTVACLAGNCLLQNGYTPELIGAINKAWQDDEVEGDAKSPGDHAAPFMGIDADQASRLFHVDNWPPTFMATSEYGYTFDVIDRDENDLTPGTPEYLARVRERVEHFIATGGAE